MELWRVESGRWQIEELYLQLRADVGSSVMHAGMYGGRTRQKVFQPCSFECVGLEASFGFSIAFV